VADLIGRRLGNTLALAAYAAAIAVPLSLMLGILAALFRNSFFDRFANASALTSISFPEFFVAYILIFFLAVRRRRVPVHGELPVRSDLQGVPLPRLPARADADPRRHRAHDADDAGRDHQPAGLPLYRDGAAQGHVAHAHHRQTRTPERAGAHHQRHRAEPRLPDHRRRRGGGRLRLSRPRAAHGRQVSARDMPVVQGIALVFAAAYVLLNLTADVLATLSNPRLVHRR
jgi:peptide/nickel transport system permease protein